MFCFRRFYVLSIQKITHIKRNQSAIFLIIKEMNALFFRFSVVVHRAKFVCKIFAKSAT